MAITCALQTKHIEALTRVITKAMLNSSQKGEVFNVNSFMDNLYSNLKERQGVDNAIQYILVPDENLATAIEGRARASIIVSIVMILGSSVFILQSLLPMKILGGLFIFGFMINLLGDLWGLKGLLTKVDR